MCEIQVAETLSGLLIAPKQLSSVSRCENFANLMSSNNIKSLKLCVDKTKMCVPNTEALNVERDKKLRTRLDLSSPADSQMNSSNCRRLRLAKLIEALLNVTEKFPDQFSSL